METISSRASGMENLLKFTAIGESLIVPGELPAPMVTNH